MDINILLDKFRYSVKNYSFDNIDFFETINLLSDYIMYEQTIIKKDNISNAPSNITYNYDELSYNAIKEFISSIKFIEEPIIGSNKHVVLNNVAYSSELEKNIYLLDKIKDSFMHLENNKTKYKFDNDYKYIIIDNAVDDYSLKCILSCGELSKFNCLIRDNYYVVDPEIEWIYKMHDRTKNIELYNNTYRVHKLLNTNYFSFRASPINRVLFTKDSPQKLYTVHYDVEGSKYESEYLSYHTYSYLSLLKASGNYDYPLLDELYRLNFSCSHVEYIQKCNKVINDMIRFYDNNTTNSYVPIEALKNRLINHITEKLKDINKVNSYILNYLRNARSHANKMGDDKFKITYFDVKYNSLQLNSNELSTPTFILEDTNDNMDVLFDKISSNNIDLNTCTNNITSSIINSNINNEYLDLFLNELRLFILQCKKDQVNPDIDKLLLPVGNASDYIDFIKKVIDNSYEYPQQIGRIIS